MQHNPTSETHNVTATLKPEELELWDLRTVCKFFGGIHRTTLYRGVNSKIYPTPINVSSNVTRWLAHECRAALARMRDERGTIDKPKRGRPRRLSII